MSDTVTTFITNNYYGVDGASDEAHAQVHELLEEADRLDHIIDSQAGQIVDLQNEVALAEANAKAWAEVAGKFQVKIDELETCNANQKDWIESLRAVNMALAARLDVPA